MGNIVDFKAKAPKNSKRARRPESRETVKLWQLSQQLDALFQVAIVEQNLPAEEVAAMVAHRLGTLISTTEKSALLAQFCFRIVHRLNPSLAADTEDRESATTSGDPEVPDSSAS